MSKALSAILVEDSDLDAELTIRHLRRAGYDLRVRRVEDAEGLRSVLDEGPWDIVLCDYSLPRFSAPGALRVLHELEQEIPLVIVSGTIGEERAVECIRAGAHDYVLKDHLGRLAEVIDRELGVRSSRSSTASSSRTISIRPAPSDEREAVLGAILDGASDAIVLIDAAGRVENLNSVAEKLTGWPAAEARTRPWHEVLRALGRRTRSGGRPSRVGRRRARHAGRARRPSSTDREAHDRSRGRARRRRVP
jgi:PAS domain S-box-containing protein